MSAVGLGYVNQHDQNHATGWSVIVQIDMPQGGCAVFDRLLSIFSARSLDISFLTTALHPSRKRKNC